MDWFLYGSGLRHEKVKEYLKIRESVFVKEKIVASRFCKNSFINPFSYSFFFQFLKILLISGIQRAEAWAKLLREKESVLLSLLSFNIFN